MTLFTAKSFCSHLSLEPISLMERMWDADAYEHQPDINMTFLFVFPALALFLHFFRPRLRPLSLARALCAPLIDLEGWVFVPNVQLQRRPDKSASSEIEVLFFGFSLIWVDKTIISSCFCSPHAACHRTCDSRPRWITLMTAFINNRSQRFYS